MKKYISNNKHIIVFTIICLLLISCDNNYKKGEKLYQEHNYKEALFYYKKVKNTNRHYQDALLQIGIINSINYHLKKEKDKIDSITKIETKKHDSINKINAKKNDSISKINAKKNEINREKELITQRKSYEVALRNYFLDEGLDIEVKVYGKNNTKMKLTFALFSDVWLRDFERNGYFTHWFEIGFKYVELNDGWDYAMYKSIN